MAEARDEHSEAQKPVIEVITTVSERVNRRIVEHRPAYYGSDGEVSYDEDDSGVNTKESTRTEIFVHSKHLSKWLKKEHPIFTGDVEILCPVSMSAMTTVL